MSPIDPDRLQAELGRYARPPEELLAEDLTGVEADETLAIQGEICPHPIHLTLQKLIAMQPGQVVRVITDHTMATHNVPSAVQSKGMGNVLGIQETAAGVYAIYIQRA